MHLFAALDSQPAYEQTSKPMTTLSSRTAEREELARVQIDTERAWSRLCEEQIPKGTGHVCLWQKKLFVRTSQSTLPIIWPGTAAMLTYCPAPWQQPGTV